MAEAIPSSSAELLAAQAKSGMAGVQAYQQAQATLAAQKQSAVQTAMQEAALRGAPAGAAQSQAGIISQPYDTRIASLAQGQAGFQADMAARDQRYAAYQGGVGEARTLIPGEVEKIVAPIRARGEAEIRNTTRSGEAAVNQINANNELALTRMRAAEQAAQIAAAKQAAKDAAAGTAAKKLTGTDLEAMLSRGALAQMQAAASAGVGQIVTNEQGQKTATKAARNATTQVMIADQPPVGMGEMPLGGLPNSAMVTPQTPAAAARQIPPKPTLAPKPAGMPVEAYQAMQQQYKAALAQWMAQYGNSGTVQNIAPPGYDIASIGAPMLPSQQYDISAIGAPYQHDPGQPVGAMPPEMGLTTTPLAGRTASQLAAGVREQAANVAARQGRLAAPLAAQTAAQTAAAPSNFSGQFGSITDAQFAALQQSDPFLAAIIGGSPEKITSKNFASVIGGEPDQYGQVNPYAMQVQQAAKEQALQQLTAQGYEIDPADFANATQDDWKPGETYQQYMQRHTGSLSAQEIAKLVSDQQKEADTSRRQSESDKHAEVAAARSDYNFQQSLIDKNRTIGDTGMTKDQLSDEQLVMEHQNYLATHNADGSTKYDPTTGLAVTSSPAAQVAAVDKQSDQQAEQWILNNLPGIPPSSFGSPSKVLALVTGGGNTSSKSYEQVMPPFMEALATIQSGSPDLRVSDKQWYAIARTPQYMRLNTAQQALLKHYVTIVHDPNFDVSDPLA